MRALQLVPAAVLLLTSSVASAGLTLTYERKSASGETGTSQMMFEAGHIRMEGMGGGRGGGGRTGAVIVDAAAKKMVMLDLDKKSYFEMTEADAKQMKERMDAMRAQMAERMKNMPPDQRKQAEGMMNRMGAGGGAPMEIKYQALGTKKKVAGFACEMYKVSVGTFSSSEACIAPWGSNLVTKAEAESFRKSFAEMEKAFSSLGPMRSNDWSKAPGIPVEQSHMGQDGKVDWTMTLKSVNRGSIPAAQFQVPAGFTKQAMPMMGGPGMGPGGRGMGPGGPHGGPH